MLVRKVKFLEHWSGLYYETYFDSIDGFYKDTVGGSVTLDSQKVTLSTGSTINNYASISKMAPVLAVSPKFDKVIKFKTSIVVPYRTNVFASVSIPIFIVDDTSTISHISFYIKDNNLYGSTANGTTRTNLLLLSNLSTSWLDLEMVYIPSVSCQFFVNNNLVGTITTNLPLTNNTIQQILNVNITTLEASNKLLYLSYYRFMQEP
jgi:hypothetical protein